MNFFDVALLRNFLFIYLINIDKVLQPRLKIPCRRYAYIFKHLRVLKLKEVLELVGRFQEFSIKAINEVFLRVILKKYNLRKGIDLMKEIRFETEKNRFSKLVSFKLVLVQRLTIGSSCALNKIPKVKQMMETFTESELKAANHKELIDFSLKYNQKNSYFITPIYEVSMMISLNEILAFRRMVELCSSSVKNLPEEDLRKIAMLGKLHSYLSTKHYQHMSRVQNALQKNISFGNLSNLLDFGSSKSSSSRSCADMNLGSGIFNDDLSRNGGDVAQLMDDDAKSLFSQTGFNFIFQSHHKKIEDIGSLFDV